jgi:threonine/homoserine/homoserine lactone efflux protein
MSYFLQGLALGLAAATAPGAFQAYLIYQTLNNGWRRGALVALAPLLSDPPIILLVLLVLNQLSPQMTQVVGIAGGAFALYLAWALWKEWRAASHNPPGERSAASIADSTPPASAGGVFGRAALINLLSPGPYLFWSLVCGPLLWEALQQSALYGLSFLLGFYTAFVGGMLALAGLFHQARRLGNRAVHALILLSLVILACFGILLVVQGLNGLT